MQPRFLKTLCGLTCALGSIAPAVAAEVDSTMVNSGDWQTGSNWNPAQAPNNGADTFDVTLPTGRSADMSADVVIRDLGTQGDVTFNNASGRVLTVKGALAHGSGTFTVQSSLLLVLEGTANFSGGSVDLRNGARLRNDGELVFGPNVVVTGSRSLPTPLPTGLSADFYNTGTTRVNTALGVTLQNFTTSNTGTLQVNAGKFESTAAIYQESAAAVCEVVAGAILKSNGLNLTAGLVRGEGTYEGSSFVLGDGTGGATVSPGATAGAAGVLTFAGNLNTVSGATLKLDLNGVTAGVQYDQVVVPNGMNASGVHLELGLGLGFTPAPGYVFDILTGNNLANGTFANEAGGRVAFTGGSFKVVHNQTYVRLEDFIAVPEPRDYAAATGLGLLGLAAWRHTRRSSSRS